MNRSLTFIAWIIASFALSTYALVILPQKQIGGLQPVFTVDEGKIDPASIYPVENRGNPERGRAVYQANGCIYCHSQQVRDIQNGTDIDRGWGVRRTVARDYIFEHPPFLGSMRIGPDLANVGSAKWRNEPVDEDPAYKPAKRDAKWHYLHLYAPRTIIKDSNMPPYRYLFEKRRISGQKSQEALDLNEGSAPATDFEIIPKQEARDLVAYLLSLDRSHPVPEVKSPAPEAAKK